MGEDPNPHEHTTRNGFIVHSFTRNISGRTTVCLLGRTDEGTTFAVMDDRVFPGFWVRESETGPVEPALARSNLRASLRATESKRDADSKRGTDPKRDADSKPAADRQPSDVPGSSTTMDDERLCWIDVPNDRDRESVDNTVRSAGVRTYEADVDTADRYLMDRRIHGSIRIVGVAQPGRHVDEVFVNPCVEPADANPALVVLSIDIETDRKLHIIAISLADSRISVAQPAAASGADSAADPAPESGANSAADSVCEVLYTSMTALSGTPSSEIAYDGELAGEARHFPDEKSMLEHFIRRIGEIDPDIITGWNVVDFDWANICDRCRQLGVPLAISRSDERARFVPAQRRGAIATMFIPGRQVIDGIRLIRYGPQSYESQSLEAIAQEVLGYGKSLEASSGTAKIREIERLQHEDPRALCSYCLLDAVLVLRILDRTGLLELTLVRCRLIGISLARAWTSIRAFEFLYLESMHARGVAGPTLGVDTLPLTEAPGGTILTPEPGLFSGVLVFDFRSLYPSIMRTFNIDPIAHRRAPSDSDPIETPNGARFSRVPGLLPDLLERFFVEREAAKQRGDATASYVLKIVLNSFYGVLGASGCRFAGSELAGAITSVGQLVLRWCKRLLVENGYTVIYGDTDSIFVQGQSGAEGLADEGTRLAAEVNAKLNDFIRQRYRLESRLELEFEKVYARFFLPRLRGADPSAERDSGDRQDRNATPVARGRAKGYAGLLLARGSKGANARDSVAPETMEIKGMEAVRRDWTPLAREFQRNLLGLLFRSASNTEIRDHIHRTIVALRAGELDDRIIYTKSLRKSIGRYTTSQPPHVKAAAMLPPGDRSGLIRYVITTAGPQPAELRNATPDYQHYIDKQLAPIARQIMDVTTDRIMDAFEDRRQLSLFDT